MIRTEVTMAMTKVSDPESAVRQTVLGHLALHYMPGDEKQARRLLELLGCTLVDNGPVPGSDGFCTVLVNGSDANYADNIMFLSSATPEQVALEAAICSALGTGTAREKPVVGNFRASIAGKPESTSHIGIRFQTLEKLEQVLAAIEDAAKEGGDLEGRIQLTKYRPRAGDDPDASATVARQVAESPAFSGSESPSFAPYWIQCFVTTDLCGFGILAFGSTFELDYVFDPFLREPPTFGRKKPVG
jgi:hypothetical protein